MYAVIEVYDSGYERCVKKFKTEEEAINYCEELGWRTSEYSYLTVEEY